MAEEFDKFIKARPNVWRGVDSDLAKKWMNIKDPSPNRLRLYVETKYKGWVEIKHHLSGFEYMYVSKLSQPASSSPSLPVPSNTTDRNSEKYIALRNYICETLESLKNKNVPELANKCCSLARFGIRSEHGGRLTLKRALSLFPDFFRTEGNKVQLIQQSPPSSSSSSNISSVTLSSSTASSSSASIDCGVVQTTDDNVGTLMDQLKIIDYTHESEETHQENSSFVSR